MSGAGAGSLMGKSAKEGKEMLDKYFSMFPGLKAAIDKSKELLLKNGYVTDLIGRRRHLPDIYLPAYEAKYLDEQKNNQNFNPIICCEDRNIEDPTLLSYITKAKATKTNKDFDVLAKDAYKHGILLTANTGRIAQAERQCFNATIQGSAGTLTKKAMIDIFNDQQLRAWRAELIITVHDEVLVECPEEYAEQVEKRLPEIMINAAKELGITQPNMQCDPYNVSRWYADSAAVAIRDEFSKLEKKCADSMPAEDVHKYVLEKVIENHKEFPANSIISVIENGSDLDF
jgi:DNA polymerase I-like protein with 3'-5' exonuclease and polymerase domains